MNRWKIIIGRAVIHYRTEHNWTQEVLAARLQCEGLAISREGVARIELGLSKVNEDCILGLQRVFHIPIILLFPKDIQTLDAKFVQRVKTRPTRRVPTKKGRRKC